LFLVCGVSNLNGLTSHLELQFLRVGYYRMENCLQRQRDVLMTMSRCPVVSKSVRLATYVQAHTSFASKRFNEFPLQFICLSLSLGTRADNCRWSQETLAILLYFTDF